MKAGDLVKLNNFAGGSMSKLRGIVFGTERDPRSGVMVSVLWTDGDRTKEFPRDLEVVCK
jgi:hypothetical protein